MHRSYFSKQLANHFETTPRTRPVYDMVPIRPLYYTNYGWSLFLEYLLCTRDLIEDEVEGRA